MTLLPHHLEQLEASGIKPEVIQERGYDSATKKVDLKKLGFSEAQQLPPGLLIPIHDVQGEITFHQLRPDMPRRNRAGKAIKYETPTRARMCLDVPPSVRKKGWLVDPKVPIIITEGVKKADAAVSRGLCCVALLGVWNWRGRNEFDGKTALPDFESIALNGRDVYIAFDSDVMEKQQVHAALARLGGFLKSRNAKVKYIYLQPGEQGQKVGLDDYLLTLENTADIFKLATTELRRRPGDDLKQSEYDEREEGLYWIRSTDNGPHPTQLANFTARIVEERVEDDGVEQLLTYVIEAKQGERISPVHVRASQFQSMNWVCETLGACAILEPGFGLKERARHAIQRLSGVVPRRIAYTHTGWREVNANWVFLHAAGALGPDGPVAGMETALALELRAYDLPAPSPKGEELTRAVRASLKLLELGPDRIMAPALASTYRSVLSSSDFTVFFFGRSGTFKTETATLLVQHFGTGFSSRSLPGSWSSTDNALEELMFQAKDVLLPIDDFVPRGPQHDRQRMHARASRILRAQGNRSGRRRMRCDASLRAERPPRTSILATGEEMPTGFSEAGRTLFIEFDLDSISKEKLSLCQHDGRSGLYAQAMSAFVGFIARQRREILSAKKDRVIELRDRARGSGLHRRTPEIVAELFFGAELFLKFAQQIDAITQEEHQKLRDRFWNGLGEAAAAQAIVQNSMDPVGIYLDLVWTAFVTGEAYLEDVSGGCPKKEAKAFGWHRDDDADGDSIALSPKGKRIGWVDDEGIYLDPGAAYTTVQQAATRSGTDGVPAGERPIRKWLFEAGVLVPGSRGKERRYTIRKTINAVGNRPEVLHLRRDALIHNLSLSKFKKPDQPDQQHLPGAPEPGAAGFPGDLLWSGECETTGPHTGPQQDHAPDHRPIPTGLEGRESGAQPDQPDHVPDQRKSYSSGASRPNGPVGPVEEAERELKSGVVCAHSLHDGESGGDDGEIEVDL